LVPQGREGASLQVEDPDKKRERKGPSLRLTVPNEEKSIQGEISADGLQLKSPAQARRRVLTDGKGNLPRTCAALEKKKEGKKGGTPKAGERVRGISGPGGKGGKLNRKSSQKEGRFSLTGGRHLAAEEKKLG